MSRPAPGGTTPSSLSSAVTRWFEEFGSDGILVTDASLTVVSWNRWLEAATGVRASDVVGRPLANAFPSIAEGGLDQYYAAALNGEVKVVSHTLHRFIFPAQTATAHRQRMLQSGRIAPLYDEGRVVGTITVVEDVTERVASERALRAQIATAEAARAIAESASQAKDEFLATLSHEIRTPLNAVLGWTRMLRTRDDFDMVAVQRAIEVIDRNANAQLTLITDMLDMARITAGKVRLELAPVDLSVVTLAALDVVRPAADAKHIRLSTEFESPLPRVLGDADRLQQIVSNLLTNAIKFTDQDGVVSITLDRSGSSVRLVVADNGRGIPADFLPHIFQRFKQAEGSTSRSQGGLGLGLALVSDLVALHQGTVQAASQGPGHGTMLTVVLPAYDNGAPDTTDTEQAATAVSLSGVRVLIVDDQDDAREILGRIITGAGGIVTPASSGRAGLQALHNPQERPDVIVTDIGMPLEDGYWFLKAIREHSDSGVRGLPVIALTAFATAQDRVDALAAGFSSHLSKPFQPQALLRAVAALSGNSAPTRPHPAN